MASYLQHTTSSKGMMRLVMILTVVIPEMILQVMLVFRNEDTFWTEEKLLWLNVT